MDVFADAFCWKLQANTNELKPLTSINKSIDDENLMKCSSFSFGFFVCALFSYCFLLPAQKTNFSIINSLDGLLLDRIHTIL